MDPLKYNFKHKDDVKHLSDKIQSQNNHFIVNGQLVTAKFKEKDYFSNHHSYLTKESTLIIYHSKDVDGLFSGWLMKLKFPNSALIGYDREEFFRININGENVLLEDVMSQDTFTNFIFVDITPTDKMVEKYQKMVFLSKYEHQLIVVDHHKEAVRKLMEHNNLIVCKSTVENYCRSIYETSDMFEVKKHIICKNNIMIICDGVMEHDETKTHPMSAAKLVFKHFLSEKYNYLSHLVEVISDYDTYLFLKYLNFTPMYMDYYFRSFGLENTNLMFSLFESFKLSLKNCYPQLFRRYYFHSQNTDTEFDINYLPEVIGARIYQEKINLIKENIEFIEVPNVYNYDRVKVIVTPEGMGYDFALYQYIESMNKNNDKLIYLFFTRLDNGNLRSKVSVRNSEACKTITDSINKQIFDCGKLATLIAGNGGGHFGAGGCHLYSEIKSNEELIKIIEPALLCVNSGLAISIDYH